MKFITNHFPPILLIVTILAISGIAHGYNMFRFPYYGNDEGTYISQAWSLLHDKTLAPYTYWYDHAPAGWIFLSFWFTLIGGFFQFGTSINTGRVFILILHLATTFLLFDIVRKITGRTGSALIAVTFFALSPLAIYFQRLVLLDNIMVFWVFVSLWLLYHKPLTLHKVIISAVCFGIACLTKETAVLLFPAFIYLVYTDSHPLNRRFALMLWPSVSLLVISFYLLFSLLKSEFLPEGVFGDVTPHVSMLETLFSQAERGKDIPIWNPQSDFYASLMEWIRADRFTVVSGIVITVISAFASIRIKKLRVPVLLVLSFWLFLLRGKLVINFYIIPLIPLTFLCAGILFDTAFYTVARFMRLTVSFLKIRIPAKAFYYAFIFPLAIGIGWHLWSHPIGQYTTDETASQVEALSWMKGHIASQTHLIVDNSLFVDLRASRAQNDRAFPNADWFWKVEKDPEVYSLKLKDDWKNIEYIALSHDILKKIKDGELPLIKNALDNSILVSDWADGSQIRNVIKYESNNGNWMSMYKVDSKEKIALDESWSYYKAHFIHEYGRVIDPARNDTTSEGQSYALLRAAWQDDKSMFDGIWAWTQDHMQHRNSDKLLSWVWKDNKLTDFNSATDADEDIALALLFAYRKWNNPLYYTQSLALVKSIWEKEIKEINGAYYVLSGSNAERENGFLINPSYLSPATYKIFAYVDSDHPWERLASDSYRFLNSLREKNMALPPNWLLVGKDTGDVSSASQYVTDHPDLYGHDAFRVTWRVALDALWFNSPEAKEYLSTLSSFYKDQLQNSSKIYALYDANGQAQSDYSDMSTDTGAFFALSVTDLSVAQNFYKKEVLSQQNETHWGDGTNYYDQNWAWFAAALKLGELENVWSQKPSTQLFSSAR